MNILIVAAHPDDEVLGMGGTIKKISKNNSVSLCVVSEGVTAQYADKNMIKVRENACKKAGKILGISNFFFLSFPDARLDTIPQLEINVKLEKIIKKTKPTIVYSPPYNDLNTDHSIVFNSLLVATRLHSSTVKKLLCYQLPGLVKFPFKANVYENITNEISYKIKSFKAYKTEVEKFPHPRSIESIESLSMQKGVESNLKNAESFELIRQIN